MASLPNLSLFFLSFSLLSLSATSVPEPDLLAALSALRRHGGYSLFANAVATSDLYFSLLDSPSVTLFPPPDASVFSLDMSAASAADYLSALRRHVLPDLRLSLLDLRSSPPSLPTLLPHHPVRVTSTSPLEVENVRVAAPGVFLSRMVAVHGLDGMILLPSHQREAVPPASDVAEPPERAIGHVIMAGKGNTFSLEQKQQETTLTCPLS